MEAVRVETIVQQNGRVIVENLPFDEGDHVEVIVFEQRDPKKDRVNDPYPLRGTPYHYDDPFSPLISLDDSEPFK